MHFLLLNAGCVLNKWQLLKSKIFSMHNPYKISVTKSWLKSTDTNSIVNIKEFACWGVHWLGNSLSFFFLRNIQTRTYTLAWRQFWPKLRRLVAVEIAWHPYGPWHGCVRPDPLYRFIPWPQRSPFQVKVRKTSKFQVPFSWPILVARVPVFGLWYASVTSVELCNCNVMSWPYRIGGEEMEGAKLWTNFRKTGGM